MPLLRGRLVGAWVTEGGGLTVCFMPGHRAGLSTGMAGRLLRDDGTAVPGSEFTIFKASSIAAFAKVKLGLDQLVGRGVEITLDHEE
jgi:hypothetical protein